MPKVTDQQRKMLDFIRKRHEKTGVYPSVREIAAHMDYKSTNTVDYHLRRLEMAGEIERAGRLARTFAFRELQPRRRVRRSPASSAERPGIPLIGRVAAGRPILAEQNFHGLMNFQSYFHCDDRTFALHVQGDSMIDAGIVDGDIVIVRQQTNVENGEIGVALIGDEATVKRIYDEGPRWRLEPENCAMEPIFVNKEEALFRIAGKVIGVIRKV